MEVSNKKIRNYQDALDFLYSRLPMYSRMGAPALKPGLDNIMKLCRHLGNPQDNFKIIHIAGTNGKGTVSHLTAAILQSQGYNVGLHISPHYKDLRERFKVNGRLAPKKFVTQFLNKHQDIIDDIRPSYFELLVAMSFDFFRYSEVDYAVIEVGLGGRLDSTNIVHPILSVITNISYDHMHLLGNTLPEIAGEKAGIIKNGIPVIIGEYQEEVADVFIKKAKNENSPVFFAREIVADVTFNESLQKTNLKANLKNVGWIDFTVNISGPFQNKNIVTALAILDFLYQKNIIVDLERFKSSMPDFSKMVNYIGRWQVLAKSPLVIADSAHNVGGLNYIIHKLNACKPENLHIILGFVTDKSRRDILSQLPKNAHYYFVNANIPRALPSNELLSEAKEFGLTGDAYESVKEGYRAAKSKASKQDFVFIGGSVFVVAEVI